MTTTTAEQRPAANGSDEDDKEPTPGTAADSAALAAYDPTAGSQGVIVGKQITRFQHFAQVLAGSDLLPDGLRGKPSNVFMALMQGLDLGLRPMQALNLIDVIKGKPCMSAQGMRAQILAAGHQFRIIEQTDTTCTIAAHRTEWPDDEWPTTTFTIEQATKAKLTGGDNWQKYPADMLLARATSRMAKAYFSDVTNGLSSVEELLDVAAGERPSLAQVAQRRDEKPATEGRIVEAELVDEDAQDAAVRDAVLEQAARGKQPPQAAEPVEPADSGEPGTLDYAELSDEERAGGGD